MFSSNGNTRLQRLRSACRRWAVIACLLPFLLIHRIAFCLDNWIFPRLGLVEVLPPLFIVGLPRSGTTYFHRLVASQGGVFTTFPLWELLFAPALCEKYVFSFLGRVDSILGAPLTRFTRFVQRLVVNPLSNVHPTGLSNPEEDYLGLLSFDSCFLRVLLFPFSERSWSLAQPESLSEDQRQKILRHYRGLLQRHQAFRGQGLRIVSKNPSFTMWTDYLASEFPGSQFVGLRRDPIEAVGSQLSSIAPTLASFGYQASDPRIAGRFVRMLAVFWNEIEQLQDSKDFVLLAYEDLVRDPYRLVMQILMDCEAPEDLLDLSRLATLCERGRNYQSAHQYCLAEFGLSEPVVRDLFEMARQDPGFRDKALVDPPQRSLCDTPSSGETIFLPMQVP